MPERGEALDLAAGTLRLRLLPALGGAVAAFWSEAGGRCIDWFRPAPPDTVAKGDVLACGHIPLVPFSGRIRDAVLNFAGRTWQLPRNVAWENNALHGQGWQSAWTVAQADGARSTLTLDYAGGGWPWPYRATQAFALSGDGLRLALSVENRGDTPMPAGLGVHPWFPATPQMRLTAKVTTLWEIDAGNLYTGSAPVPARFNFTGGLPVAGTGLCNGFTGWDGRAVIDWPERGARLTMTASPALRHLVIYSPPGEPYVCIEPVSHSVDAFNLEVQGVPDNGTVVLAPGQTLRGEVEFVVATGS